MNLTYTAAKNLATALITRAIRDATKGSVDAIAWLRSAESEMWFNAAGFDAEDIKGKINSFCDHPKMVTIPENNVRHGDYFEALWGWPAV